MAVVGTAQEVTAPSADVGTTSSYTRVFQVRTDSVSDGPEIALAASGIPGRGSYYAFGNEANPYSFATKATARLKSESDTRKLWEVTVSYEHPSQSDQKDDSPNSQYGDPLDIGWKISGSFANEEKAVAYDRQGNMICNSVKEPFIDPPLTKPAAIDTIVLRKNTMFIDLKLRSDLINKVNSGPLWGLQKRQVKLARWDYEILYYGNKIPYVSNTWEFQIKSQIDPNANQNAETGWTDWLLDQGTRYRVDGTTLDPRKRYAPINLGERQIAERLNGNEELLDVDDESVYLSFEIEDEVDFTLYFPSPLPGPFV